MKLWITMFVVMVIIVVRASIRKLHPKTTNQISHTLNTIKDAVRNDQWSQALQSLDGLTERWSKLKETWSPFIHNHDLQTFTLHLARLKAYMETAERGSALAEITNLELQLIEIQQQEILSLKNVL